MSKNNSTKKLKEFEIYNNVGGWAKMHYCFVDLDRYDSALMLNFLIDKEGQTPACKDEGYEDYYLYLNSYIKDHLPGASDYCIREMLKDLELHDYISIMYKNGVKIYKGVKANRIHFIQLNYEAILKAMGVDVNEQINEHVKEHINEQSKEHINEHIKKFNMYIRLSDNQTSDDQTSVIDNEKVDTFSSTSKSDDDTHEFLEQKKKNKNKDKPVRHHYGEYGHVLLTDDQLTKLKEDFGEQKINEFIKKVDEYVQQFGKKYKDYNLTIRNWIRNEKPQPSYRINNQPSYRIPKEEPKKEESKKAVFYY